MGMAKQTRGRGVAHRSDSAALGGSCGRKLKNDAAGPKHIWALVSVPEAALQEIGSRCPVSAFGRQRAA